MDEESSRIPVQLSVCDSINRNVTVALIGGGSGGIGDDGDGGGNQCNFNVSHIQTVVRGSR